MKRNIPFVLCLLMSAVVWAGEPAKHFTSMEINHLRVKTPGLFGKEKSFSIRLDTLKEGEFCFPLPGGKVISRYDAEAGIAEMI